MKKIILGTLLVTAIIYGSGGYQFSSGGGGGTWGSITGTLSDQTDLNTSLGGKVSDTGDTLTGALLLPNGSVSAASYSFSSTGNSDNGLYLVGDNTVGVTAGGAKLLQIDEDSASVHSPSAAANFLDFFISGTQNAHIYGNGSVNNFYFTGRSGATSSNIFLRSPDGAYSYQLTANTSGTIDITGPDTTKPIVISNVSTYRIGGGFVTTPTAVNLTADDQSLTLTSTSHVRLTSDNTTADQRTFVLADGNADGQHLVLEWNELNASGAGELADSGNANLSAAWTPDLGDTLSLRWNNAGSEWREVSRSNN